MTSNLPKELIKPKIAPKRIPPVVLPQRNFNVRNLKQTMKPLRNKPVASVDFLCPCGCKKTYVLTLDKKVLKALLKEVKCGGAKIPRGALIAPVIRKAKKS